MLQKITGQAAPQAIPLLVTNQLTNQEETVLMLQNEDKLDVARKTMGEDKKTDKYENQENKSNLAASSSSRYSILRSLATLLFWNIHTVVLAYPCRGMCYKRHNWDWSFVGKQYKRTTF